MVLRRLISAALLALASGTAGAQPVGVPPPQMSATLSATDCPGTGCVVLSVSSFASAAVQVASIGAQTLTFEVSLDGTNYQAITATPTNSTTGATTTTATGLWTVPVGGMRYLRVRSTAYTSGAALVYLQAAASGGSSGGGGSGSNSAIAAPVPSTASPVAVKDNAGNLAYPLLDGSGNLLVAVTGAGSGGTSSVDGSGYVAGTSAGTAIIGARDDTSPSTVAEDKLGIARITTNRAVHTNLRDATGAELGVAAAPVQVSLANTAANAANVNVAVNAALPAGTNAIGSITNTAFQANAGTNLNTSALALSTTQTDRSQKTQVTDGTRDGTVKAGSTLPAATDTALVVTARDAVTANATLSAETTKVIGTVNIASGQALQANAGTNLNTSALALESGGNLASVKTNSDRLDIALSTLRDALLAEIAAVHTTAASTTAPGKIDVVGGLASDGTYQPVPLAGNALLVRATASAGLPLPACNPVRRVNCQPKGF